MINEPFIWGEKAASLVVIRLMPFRAMRDFPRKTQHLRKGADASHQLAQRRQSSILKAGQ
jgi:hypothetical protein